MTKDTISDEELQAFIDEELDPRRTAEVAAVVAASPELMKRVVQYRADKMLIASLYRPLVERPVPASLLRAIEPRARRPTRHIWIAVSGLAAAAGIVLAVLLTQLPATTSASDRLIAEALDARAGSLHPERRLADASLPDAPARDVLVADATSLPVKVPDLSRAGFTLAAIEIYPGSGAKHSLQLTYRNAQGATFTVYLHGTTGPDKFDLVSRGKTQICLWQNEDASVVMVGEFSPKEMLKIASLTYADLNL